jgi:hypothetical protein
LFEQDWPEILILLRGVHTGIDEVPRLLVMSLFNPYTGDDPNHAAVERRVQHINGIISDDAQRVMHDYDIVDVHDHFAGRLVDGRWKTCVWLGFCETTRDPHPNDAGHDEIAALHLRTYLSRI